MKKYFDENNEKVLIELSYSELWELQNQLFEGYAWYAKDNTEYQKAIKDRQQRWKIFEEIKEEFKKRIKQA